MTLDKALARMAQDEELRRLRENKAELEQKVEEYRISNEELEVKLAGYKRELDEAPKTQQEAILKAHLRAISGFLPGEPKDSMDEIIINFIASPGFIEIYQNAIMISSIYSRAEYLIMELLRGNFADTFVEQKQFFFRIAPLGLGLSCPYYVYNEKVNNNEREVVYDKCEIRKPQIIDSLCRGEHYKCVIFEEMSRKFASGEIEIVKTPRMFKPPEIAIPRGQQLEVERKLLEEIEQYWRDE